MQKLEVLHYPRLDTVLMIEKVLEKQGNVKSINELMRKLPKQVMRGTLHVVLDYLEERGHIYKGSKGITWIKSDSKKLRKLLESSMEA